MTVTSINSRHSLPPDQPQPLPHPLQQARPEPLTRFERNRPRGQVGRLPPPFFRLYEWQSDGACADVEPSLFYHPEGERGPHRAQRTRAALAICATCPVIQACREYALSSREPYGVWGGLTVDDRAQIARGWTSADPGAGREAQRSSE